MNFEQSFEPIGVNWYYKEHAERNLRSVLLHKEEKTKDFVKIVRKVKAVIG